MPIGNRFLWIFKVIHDVSGPFYFSIQSLVSHRPEISRWPIFPHYSCKMNWKVRLWLDVDVWIDTFEPK